MPPRCLQVDLSGAAGLEALVGAEEVRTLWRLAARFREHPAQCTPGRPPPPEGAGDAQDGVQDGAASPCTPTEIFVRRYSCTTRPWVPFHCDRAACTLNVALSNDAAHEGGRLLALLDGKAQRIERAAGEATVHSSRLCHAVSCMGRGTRYSLICFLP